MIKVGPNQSQILTDEEWREWVLYHRKYESLEHFEQNLKQHKEMQEHYSQLLSKSAKSLCDRVWHNKTN